MKCKYCGADVGLEDLVCSHCGMPNEEARKHAQDMQRYSRDYERTKTEVSRSAKKAGRLAAHGIILGLVIVANILVYSLLSNSYSLQRDWQVRKAEKNFQTHQAMMDEYLDKQDYLGFSAYCQASYIDGYSSKYRDYEQSVRMCRQYRYVYADMAKMVFASDKDADSIAGYRAESFYDTLDTLYKLITPEYIEEHTYKADTAVSLRTAEGIRKQLNGMLTAFLHLTDEEIESLPAMTKTKRDMLLEEHILEVLGAGNGTDEKETE